jgi:serine/threonine protein kinase
MSEASHQPAASSDADLAVGQVIGEYEVEAKVGQGGFGTVYRASHPLIGKLVAIKVLARKFSADPEMVSRFIAEARSVNQIRHRNIIDIFLFGQLADGRHYYVMEYLDGETLDATIDREHQMPLGRALPILRAIARALDAAHAKGITHRDLKPENIFLVRDSDGGEAWPKLLDFGIAKLMSSGEEANQHKTRTGIPIGTPYYMSPEQCRGKDVDHRTDYYAFGIVAYQMLTGTHAIDADDFMEIMIKQLEDEPVPPSSLVPELPAGVDEVVAWLMKKSRDQRPPNLATAIRALEQAAETAGISVARPTAGWDAETPPPGTLARPPTASAGSALAATQPSHPALPSPSVTLEPGPKTSRAGLILGVIAIVAAAIVAVIVLTRTSVPPQARSVEPAAPPAQAALPTPAPSPAATPAPTAPPVSPVSPVAPPPNVVVTPTPAPVSRPAIKKPAAKPKKQPGHDDLIDVFGKDPP